MKLEGIINVSGKPGLFKIISRSNNNVIIESLTDQKRTVIYSQIKLIYWMKLEFIHITILFLFQIFLQKSLKKLNVDHQ